MGRIAKPSLNKKQKKALAKKPVRYVRKNIGLGYKVPLTASNADYVDWKCPFTGEVHVHGRILRGVVHSMKMDKTIIVKRHYLHYIRKYKRYEKRNKSIAVHCSPCFIDLKVGDTVEIGETRPTSKTKAFTVLKVIARAASTGKFEKF